MSVFCHNMNSSAPREYLSLPTGEIVYYVASLAVLYSPESQTQRHYRGHTRDIECLATHPQAALCATGQAGSGADSAHVQVIL